MSFIHKMYFVVVFLISFSSSALFSTVITCSSMGEVPSHVDKETLLIFDIDNTIYTNVQMLGADCWFNDFYTSLKSNPYVSTKEELLDLYTTLQKKTHVRLVETITPSVLQELQSKDLPFIFLTSRGKELTEATFRQMGEVRVRFPNLIGDKDISLPSPCSFKDGIFFTSGTNKGSALLSILKETGIKAKRVVMVDDLKRHLDAVEKALESIGVPFLGLHYAPSFKIVQEYDTKVASKELDRFLQDGTLISDDEARLSTL